MPIIGTNVPLQPDAVTWVFFEVADAIYSFYYRHWGYKRWTFGQKWNALIEREEVLTLLKEKGFQFQEAA